MVPNPAERILEDEREAIDIKRPSRTKPRGALNFNETWRFSSMTLTFMNLPKYLFTSESVTEGHPDKLCDQISDAVLDALYEQDIYSRVACETATKTGYVMALGEITTHKALSILMSWYVKLSRKLGMTAATKVLMATPVV
jgi:hypothetical protein